MKHFKTFKDLQNFCDRYYQGDLPILCSIELTKTLKELLPIIECVLTDQCECNKRDHGYDCCWKHSNAVLIAKGLFDENQTGNDTSP